MKKKVVITGIGIVSSIAMDKDGLLNAVINQETGIHESQICKKYDNLKYYKVAESDFTFSKPKEPSDLDRTELMSRRAIDDAINDSNLDLKNYKNLTRVGLSFATSLAGSDNVINYYKTNEKDYEWLTTQRDYINRLVKDYSIKGPSYTTSSACASGTSAAGIAFDLVKNNEADIVITGGTDALSEFSLFGFYSLKNISSNICKPFDKDRDGINLGEASAFFIFEEYEHAKKRNARIYCEIAGYGLANDAYHNVAPDPEAKGAELSIKLALKEAQIHSTSINYINAHGTGTISNDSMEYKLIKRKFRKNVYFSSTKSLTGHCLAAAGSIELAICIMSLYYQFYPKTYNSNLDIDENDDLSTLDDSGEIKYVLSNSFAFAGNISSLVLKKIEKSSI